MSEASTPNTPEEKPASAAVNSTATPPAKTPGKGGGTGLAAFALLVGLAGAGAGGWSLWQLQQIQGREQQQSADLQRTRDDSAKKVDELAQRLDSRLSALPSAAELDERRRLLANVQSDQQRMSQRLESVLSPKPATPPARSRASAIELKDKAGRSLSFSLIEPPATSFADATWSESDRAYAQLLDANALVEYDPVLGHAARDNLVLLNRVRGDRSDLT